MKFRIFSTKLYLRLVNNKYSFELRATAGERRFLLLLLFFSLSASVHSSEVDTVLWSRIITIHTRVRRARQCCVRTMYSLFICILRVNFLSSLRIWLMFTYLTFQEYRRKFLLESNNRESGAVELRENRKSCRSAGGTHARKLDEMRIQSRLL